MKKLFRLIPILAFALLIFAQSNLYAHAAPVPVPLPGVAAVKAKSGYLMDYATGTELYGANAGLHLPVASMVKIMTVLLSLEHVESGKIGFDSTITVSQNAASMGGSQAFLDANAQYKVDDLIKSIVIASANDSCV
ncbi:MAG: serine hydrolase, partial [Clostridiales bacterium]|nr:serine hydrolase [Clostridiales bacterium]